ncbi:MAG: septum formation initiator family protein [Candidatus Marinimicrobia bacterium]|nr:septum formation initiator family protein [Candidatus Neomarinimicrobiota bacterium]MCH7762349.1 septum formation initiator family protein [Candidatus Neomarinimicrobiota bacterium]
MRRYSSMQRKRLKGRHSQSIEIQKKLVRGVLILGAIVLLIIFFWGDHGVYQLYRLRQEKADIQKLIVELRKEKQNLEAEKTRLETDFEYIERLARERYRMAKKGEKVYKVIPKSE